MSTTQRRRRCVAGLASAALVGAGLAVFAGAPAQAEPVQAGATLTWGISAYTNGNGVGTFELPIATAPATFADSLATFTGGEGRTDTGTHVTEVQYHGTVRIGSSHGYTIDISDPAVSVDADGDGTLSADVAWDVVAQGANPASAGSQDDVTLTTFTAEGSSWTGFSLAATPEWDGVATGVTYGTATPVDGKSWSPEFVNVLPSTVRPFFYASGTTASNALKAPSAFTATVPGPKVTVGTPTYAHGTATFSVSGAGFSAVTKPGDAGVYVGIAPAGTMPDVSSISAMSNFLTAAYAMPGDIVDGAFTKPLTLTTDLVDPDETYAIYTWQAHAHSNTTQDTQTPLPLDVAALWAVEAGKPGISGNAVVGNTLTATAGTWGPTGVSLAYQWLANGKAIAGATSTTLALTPALAGSSVTVAVTGTRAPGASATATSTAVKVAAGMLTVAKPRVAGKAKVGKKLKATVPAPAGATVSYQWFKGAKAIKGAEAKKLKVTKKLRGKKVSVKVTISQPGYATVTIASAKTKVKR